MPLGVVGFVVRHCKCRAEGDSSSCSEFSAVLRDVTALFHIATATPGLSYLNQPLHKHLLLPGNYRLTTPRISPSFLRHVSAILENESTRPILILVISIGSQQGLAGIRRAHGDQIGRPPPREAARCVRLCGIPSPQSCKNKHGRSMNSEGTTEGS
ncbi:hypothetical protein BC826DRAFT_998491 [Russula brevipes]|nr:hypothetical protein BC826DRAFT_998491 [Russula brevipes]